MKLFSQRKGIKPNKNIFQTDNIDKDLRISLWNALHMCYLENLSHPGTTAHRKFHSNLISLFRMIWIHYFELPYDDMPLVSQEIYDRVKDYFFKCQWYEVYDFIEYIANNFDEPSVFDGTNSKFMDICNSYLKTELSAYRFVGGEITQITEKEEIAEIEEALAEVKEEPVRVHIKTALKMISDREDPDYRNSIKESISAVESLCKSIANKPKATLADALSEIEKNIELHGDLKSAFDSLYGYTSGARGIRHALMDMPNLDFEDAKFILVSCSAFINFLLEKSSKAGINI